MTMQAAVRVEPDRLNGREFDATDSRIGNLLKLIRSRSRLLDDYRDLLSAMTAAGEYQTLAEMLLDGECRHALEHGTAMARGNGQILVCRDEAKTVLITQASQFVRDPTDPAAARVEVLANDMVYLVLGQGRVTITRYSVDDAVTGQPRLLEAGESEFSPFESFVVAAGREAIEVSAAGGDVWLLQLVMSEHQTLVQHFDKGSMQRVATTSANYHASRIEFVLELFKRFRHVDASELVDSIGTCSRFHFVRWKAIQTLLHLDLTRGQAALVRALDDSHPQVRQAASKTLTNFAKTPI
jgi:hypothetical protein